MRIAQTKKTPAVQVLHCALPATRASRRGERGSVLVISLFVSALLGVSLGTYLLIARSEYIGASYSQSWHKALTMAEGGIEEALAQINGPGVSSSPMALASIPVIHREFDGGSYDVAVITGPGNSATIYSTGYVTIASFTNTISRVLIARTTNAPMFTSSIAALTNISMTSKGKGVTFADSFDSTKPNSGVGSHGLVACLSGSLGIGSGSIHGDLLLGPTASAGSTKPSGSILHDLNTDFPEVIAPPSTWLPAAFAHQYIDGVDYTYVFKNSGDYTINSTGPIYVGTNANVCLQIQSPNFTASSLYIAGTKQRAGKLVMYATQPTVSLGEVTVESGKPANFLYLGTPQNKSLTLNSDSDFYGTIYAPSADFHFNVNSKGKSIKTASFSGSCIANSVQINGAATFHFDEDLTRNTPLTRGYVITSWKEL